MSQGGWGQPPGGGSGWGGGPPAGDPGDANPEVPPMPLGMPPGPAPGDPRTPLWSPFEALTFGWERFKRDPGTIFGAFFVAHLVIGLPSMISGGAKAFYETLEYGHARPDPFDTISLAIQGTGMLGQSITSALITGGLTLFALRIAKGEPFQFGDVFSRMNLFVTMFVIQLLTGLLVTMAGFPLIVPGVILALFWSLAIMLAVDRELGPLEAMKQSWRLTNGHKLDIFLFWLLVLGLALVCTFCTCCLGFLVVNPVISVAFAFIYLRITGQPVVSEAGRAQ
jgi:hypothetical protein